MKKNVSDIIKRFAEKNNFKVSHDIDSVKPPVVIDDDNDEQFCPNCDAVLDDNDFENGFCSSCDGDI